MTSRWPTVIAVAGGAAWLAIALITWWSGAPLGHDESQYAIAAREALAGEEPRWFYLSRAMSAIAAPGIWLGESERALRVVPVVLGLLFVLATYVFARRTVGPRAAAWAVVVLAVARPIVRISSDLLSDMPAAACLIAALAVIANEIDRAEGPRWRLVLVAPLFAAAFYVRYGSVIPIAVIVGASILVGARTLIRRPLPVVVTAAVFLVLLVPHFMQAAALLGSPLGILRLSREVPLHEQFADGLITYVTSNPLRYYGQLTVLPLVAGVLALRIRDRKRLLAWLVGVGTLVAMGMITHGMVRYILVPIALLVVLGTDQLLRWIDAVPMRARQVIAVVVVIASAYFWLLIVRKQLHIDDVRRARIRGTLMASRAIRADAAGAPCVVIGYHSTQLEWYSGCRVPLIMDGNAIAEALARGQRAYAVRDHTPNWVPRWQPVFHELPGTAIPVLVLPGTVEVARMAAPPALPPVP